MCHLSIRETDFEDPCASPGLKEIVSKPIRKAVAAWVIPEVQFMPERAGYKREHPKLVYNKTGKLTKKHKLFHINYWLSIFGFGRLTVQSYF
jgi:hypothetical protein